MRATDGIWIECAARLGLPVERGGDAYVHFDGRALRIAGDADLDEDDSLAQLILHEICHWLVEGPGARHAADWGLDNTTDGDRERELAAVRLQAHLAGAHGLRGALFPTTIVRAFYQSLGADALGHAGASPSTALARAAAERAAKKPFAPALDEALAATARALGVALHRRSGHALAADGRACGDCAWRTESGFCRQASSRFAVATDEPACVRHEPALDCGDCAACCRGAFDSVTVSPRDLVRRARPDLVVERGSYRELARAGDRCAALYGSGPYNCSIYEERPRTCRDFEIGGRHCLTARKRLGLTI